MSRVHYAVLAIPVAGLAAAAGYWYAMSRMPAMPAEPAAAQPATQGDRKVLYWHDPMYPEQKIRQARQVALHGHAARAGLRRRGRRTRATVAISPRVQQNLGVRTAEATARARARRVEAVGNVAYNERDVAVVQARTDGFVERLYVRAPLDPVREGPAAGRAVRSRVGRRAGGIPARSRACAGTDVEALLERRAQRMRLLGMTEDADRRGRARRASVQPRLTVTAPIGGVVAELGVREGMTVAAGAPLFRINGLGTVWVNAEVPESQAAQVRPGQRRSRRASPALPGRDVQGHGQRDPARGQRGDAHAASARIELANPGGAARCPGMFATVDFRARRARESAAGADRSGDPDRQAQRGHRRRGRRQVRAGRRRDRASESDGDDRDPQGPRRRADRSSSPASS